MDLLAKLGVWGAPLALLFLCLSCITTHSGMVAGAVRSLTSASLQSASITGVDVDVDGRDVILNGRVGSDEAKIKAGAVALLSPGVRSVDNRLTVGLDATTLQPVLTKLLLEKKIEFETAKSLLLPKSIPILEEVLRVLQQAPQLAIRVSGHTDSDGDPVLNRNLSRDRAQAVVNWLSQNGIGMERMSAVGLGPDKPLVPNTTPEGRATNRRVEITVN